MEQSPKAAVRTQMKGFFHGSLPVFTLGSWALGPELLHHLLWVWPCLSVPAEASPMPSGGHARVPASGPVRTQRGRAPVEREDSCCPPWLSFPAGVSPPRCYLPLPLV